MLPQLAFPDIPDCRSFNAVASGNDFQRLSGRGDLFYLAFGQLRSAVSLASRLASHLHRVGSVFLRCDVFEVFDAIVGLVAILVIDLYPRCPRSKKCRSDQVVNARGLCEPRVSSTEVRVFVATGGHLFQFPIEPRVPDPAVARHFIEALETNNSSPFAHGSIVELISGFSKSTPTLMKV